MTGEDRRQGDDLILKMHGNIKTLLERSKNTDGWMKTLAEAQKTQGEKSDEMDGRISKNEGSILGIKWVSGAISVVFVAITGYLGAKK